MNKYYLYIRLKFAQIVNWWYGDKVCWADLVMWAYGLGEWEFVQYHDNPEDFDCDFCMKHYSRDRKELWLQMTKKKNKHY